MNYIRVPVYCDSNNGKDHKNIFVRELHTNICM